MGDETLAKAKAEEPRLIERQVTLLVSEDTNLLWDEMALRLGLESFDALAQTLVVYGAFLVASTDLGYVEGIRPLDLGPEQLRAVIVPWLRARTGP